MPYFLVLMRRGPRFADEALHDDEHERFVDSLVREEAIRVDVVEWQLVGIDPAVIDPSLT